MQGGVIGQAQMSRNQTIIGSVFANAEGGSFNVLARSAVPIGRIFPDAARR
jgi:hypothetical protein